jgi:predicted helicase
MPVNSLWVAPLQEYADTVQSKFAALTSGEPEDQLRAPFERLLVAGGKAAGITVVPIGETLLGTGLGRPDFGVECDGLLCGYLELKAPGKGADTSSYTGHDRKQWTRFAELPNVLYSDGQQFALYRKGQLDKLVKLDRNPTVTGKAAINEDNARQLEGLFNAFFRWEPDVPTSSKQLAQYLAPLCRMLRDDVLDALRTNVAAVKAAAADWRRYLFPGADDARFADAYAQTVTFSLLLARSNGGDTLFLDEAVASLTHANTLLSRSLKVLTDPLVKEHLSASLGMLQRVIDKVPSGTMSGGRRDPWLHFYEDFLAEYDPKLRRDVGAYYTPVEVVQAQVRLVDDLLRHKLSKKHGFATGGVNVLDPAVGTGTYLLGVIEHVMEEVRKTEGPGAMPARADLLGAHLFGFEIMVGPYAVAALRLTRMLQQYGGHPPADGVQIMLNNTMESPHEKIPELPLLYQPIGLEHKRAKRVKETVPVLVCLGNPPYDRHEAATLENRPMTGGWVRWGESHDGRDAILRDFIDPVREARKGGDLKNLYNLYVYFWRWALWKTFEHELAQGPGVVTYITASSFLDGDAFLGMRRHMRKVCDEIWIIDLGGEGRGPRLDENVFAIQTPVAITIATRYGGPQLATPAKVHYVRVEGTRAEKLQKLEQLNRLDDLAFKDCPQDWNAPFTPVGKGNYFEWPLLTDLMPWQQSGLKAGRTWVIAASEPTLRARYDRLVSFPEAERQGLFKDSPTGRKCRDRGANLTPEPTSPEPVAIVQPETPAPRLQMFGFRSFDRQWVIADGRFLDRPGPPLWTTWSDRQVYITTMMTQPLGSGPALIASAHVPDLHFFRGSYGGKDVFPLYRDQSVALPNMHPQLLDLLMKTYGIEVCPEDVAAYFYALLAHPAFTARYHKELESKELRVPLSADKDLFERAVALGRELLFLHTYGERCTDRQVWPATVVKSAKPVNSTSLPERFAYDAKRQVLVVGNGEFGPVLPSVYQYEVSGLKVVQSWLGYRMKNRRGRKSSALDDIGPPGWTADYTSELLRLLNLLTRTVDLHSLQAALLDEIVCGPLLNTHAFGPVPDAARKAPREHGAQLDL